MERLDYGVSLARKCCVDVFILVELSHIFTDTTTWENTQTLKNQKWVWDAAFCADSSYLVTSSSDHIARLWNLRTGTVVRQYHGHQSAVTCVALNDSSV